MEHMPVSHPEKFACTGKTGATTSAATLIQALAGSLLKVVHVVAGMLKPTTDSRVGQSFPGLLGM